MARIESDPAHLDLADPLVQSSAHPVPGIEQSGRVVGKSGDDMDVVTPIHQTPGEHAGQAGRTRFRIEPLGQDADPHRPRPTPFVTTPVRPPITERDAMVAARENSWADRGRAAFPDQLAGRLGRLRMSATYSAGASAASAASAITPR